MIEGEVEVGSENLAVFVKNLNALLKEDIIKHSETGNLYEPKSTKHLIFCNESKKWHPITLVSSLYNLSLK